MQLSPNRRPVGDVLTRGVTVRPGFTFNWAHWNLKPVIDDSWRAEQLAKELQIPAPGADLPTTADYTGELF